MRRVLTWTWWLVGVALVALGVVVVVSASQASGDFGWFAYTPLSDAPREPYLFDGGARIVSRDQQLGVAVLGLGVLLLVGAGGYRLGVRAARRRRPDTADPV